MEREGTCSILEHMGNDGKQSYQLNFAAAQMGAEIIPGLLDSVRKATIERCEYGIIKNSAFAAEAKS